MALKAKVKKNEVKLKEFFQKKNVKKKELSSFLAAYFVTKRLKRQSSKVFV